MYHPIFARSFSKYERKRFGCFGLALCLVLALTICSTFKPSLHPLSLIGDALNFGMSIDAVQDILSTNDTVVNSEPKGSEAANLENNEIQDMLATNDTVQDMLATNDTVQEVLAKNDTVQDILATNDTVQNSAPIARGNSAANLQLSINVAANMHLVNDTGAIPQPKVEKMVEPLCKKITGGADYCELEGDIRIQANTSTIFVVTNQQTITNSWNIQPYPRKNIDFVKHWTVKLVGYENEDSKIPQCTQNHSKPAILFSMGGFTGNHFHDFADLLFPLYTTSSHFQKEVHFLASDVKPWWLSKYREILSRLSRHQVVDIDRENVQVHCYQKSAIGLNFYRELFLDQAQLKYPIGTSMSNFRKLLWQTYSLERKRAVKLRKGDRTRPRLLLVSRKRTRILTNEEELSRLASKQGFEVVKAEADTSTSLSKFAQLVNSCDVMLGIHGAGLTNMLFLPDNAILIQVVPLGKIDFFARLDFGDPAGGMNIRYLEYKISAKESSLSSQYPMDDPVLRDPMSIHTKGWLMIKSVYLENQNVTVDIQKFRATLVKAIKILRN